jgi:hypothetical protein
VPADNGALALFLRRCGSCEPRILYCLKSYRSPDTLSRLVVKFADSPNGFSEADFELAYFKRKINALFFYMLIDSFFVGRLLGFPSFSELLSKLSLQILAIIFTACIFLFQSVIYFTN